MFLKRIELQGFKSFADKSVINFDSDVIGIVGPNGCGKSNINDAIRWVLGEQSVKSLRGSSMSDVIFSGSTQRKAVNMAEVTLVFDNSKHILNVDFEEVEVTRKLHRQSGEGEYFINKAPCRLKDIVNLVMDTGLGRDSLSIISQGNISAFADAKPEERRALFEEAAGVAKYKKRKNESLSKLNRTQENLMRLEDIIVELERQVNPLKRQAKKAEQYIEKKKELEVIEVSVLVDEIEKLSEDIDELKKKAFDMDTQKAMHETTIQVEDNKINELRNEMYQLDREVNKLQERFTKANEEVRLLETRKIEMDEKRKYALESASNAEKARELKAMVEEASFEYEDRRKRLQDLETDFALKKEELSKVESDISFSLSENQQASAILNRLENRKDVLENLARQPFNHQQAVRSILEARNTLQGIEGVVSQIFKPQTNYETAISNALAGAMYHIVTKDEASARHAISFLKKNQSGRATFLPLSVMRPRRMMKEHYMLAQNLKGFLGVASEFVENEERFNDLRDSLFGNVIIVDNLVNANEIAKMLKYGYKIVTLEGDIVNRGGSMTGGKQKNNATPLTIQKELNSVMQSLEGQRLKTDQLKVQLSALQSKKDQINAQSVQIQISLAKLDPIVKAKWSKLEHLKEEYESVAPDEDKGVDSELMEDDLIVRLSKAHSMIDEVSSSIKSKRERRMKVGNEVERKEQQVRALRRELNVIQNDMRDIEVSQAKAETRLETSMERLSATYEMTFEYAQSQKMDTDMQEARIRVKELRQEIASLGNVNLDAPQQYKEINERYEFLTKQKADLIAAKDKIMVAIDEMDEIMIHQFKEMFDKINNELNDVFRALFGGGSARLFLVDPSDILNTGIDIEVRPPGKTVQNIRLFSGGEKSLIAICVLFSILKARTMPLCIFDEVEAALDQANVERFAKYITQFRGESQFIVVTHRPGTMAQCDALYGVTMQQNGVSQLLKVKLQDAINMVDKKEEVEA
ncbi:MULTISPECIES: chromosome segregation protein SMC [Bacillota]|uniref:Chromosome partition protein Smc n=2 Tax=Amedibacillus TaxID=2749846 RepID=A0A7G9GLZ1_9FIRM|nr:MULTISPECIES: chromosome segregation protein SMC [Bacillota]QNM11823.1 chromosome segregation protein SMC [[Eubacterium] hominis]MCH4287254.1 chromosome segregation protein SMC [Amedibacillus hominis]RGB50667.1 chromosome segregation protein SMC [Absiella sp. AM22-9]RGB62944.1 chromosome segregation protein SMC [Absiella sp. AM10-20]RGB64869.1 chromosome segregation protein SMC [Absiella sp. AM09-45]